MLLSIHCNIPWIGLSAQTLFASLILYAFGYHTSVQHGPIQQAEDRPARTCWMNEWVQIEALIVSNKEGLSGIEHDKAAGSLAQNSRSRIG